MIRTVDKIESIEQVKEVKSTGGEGLEHKYGIGVGSVGEGRSEQRLEGGERISQVASLEKGVLGKEKRVSKSHMEE